MRAAVIIIIVDQALPLDGLTILHQEPPPIQTRDENAKGWFEQYEDRKTERRRRRRRPRDGKADE